MSSCSRRSRRSSRSRSAALRSPVVSTVRSYSGPKPSCRPRVRRLREALIAIMPTTITTTTTAITIHTHVAIDASLVDRQEIEGARGPYPRVRDRKRLGRELLPDQLVDELRIRLSLRLAHYLADEKPQQPLFPAAVRLDLRRIRSQDLVDDGRELRCVGDRRL